jgi:hypothetical protein
MTMQKPFAITLDPGSSLANKTGSWRTQRPVYVDRLPPCNNQCPAGEDIQGWLFHAEGGEYEEAWRHLTRDNPFPAIMGRVCYHSCEGACNRASWIRPWASTRWSVSSATRPSSAAGSSSRRRKDRQARADRRRRPLGHVRGLPPAPPRPPVTVMEAGPLMGGMMRFGIPQYRLPREVLEAEMQRIVAMGVSVKLNTKVSRIEDTMKDGTFDAAFLAVGAHIGKRTYIPANPIRQDRGRIFRAAQHGRRRQAHARPPRGRVRRRQHRHRRGPHGQASGRGPKPSSSTAAPAKKCRRTTSRWKKRCRKA